MTNDHVPPKNIFPKPRPNNLIKVHACKSCNSLASKDDEYFRLKLCMSEQAGNHSAVQNNQEAAFRSLNRAESPGLRNSFLSDIHTVQLKTQAGLYLGERLAFDVDLHRIHRVVERTVRGIFYYETGHRLCSGYDVNVHSDDTLREQSAEILDELHRNTLIPLSKIPPKIIGNGVFMYRFHITQEDPFVSVWALTFYERVSFLALTGPERNNGGHP